MSNTWDQITKGKKMQSKAKDARILSRILFNRYSLLFINKWLLKHDQNIWIEGWPLLSLINASYRHEVGKFPSTHRYIFKRKTQMIRNALENHWRLLTFSLISFNRVLGKFYFLFIEFEGFIPIFCLHHLDTSLLRVAWKTLKNIFLSPSLVNYRERLNNSTLCKQVIYVVVQLN